jgi:DNA-binding CsgD family transcriptional regulator
VTRRDGRGSVALLPVPAHEVRATRLPGGAVVLSFALGRSEDALEQLGRDPLTPTQREIARLAVTGMSDAEIARARGCSRHTVSNHLRAAYRRLGIGSRAELAARISPCLPGDASSPARSRSPAL